jgi:hypothetical protein
MSAPIPLPELLIDPSEFPPGFPATVLEPAGAMQALRAIDGVPEGSTVTPADCAPPMPKEIAAIVGDRGDSMLRVVIVRADAPLSTRRDQLDRCASFTVGTGDGSSDVNVQLLPPSPVDVDDALAVEQRVHGSTALTLIAQTGDVRVIAQLTGVDGEAPDAVTLDRVFSNAVRATRRPG